MKNFVSNGRFFIIVSVFLAGLCLLRVFTVRADEQELDDVESEEVYSLQSPTSPKGWDGSRNINDTVQGDVRLTRPDEAALRIVEDDKNRTVPGIDAIREHEENTAQVEVPVKRGRSIASVPNDIAPKPQKASAMAGQNLKSKPAGQQNTYAAVEDDTPAPTRAGPGFAGDSRTSATLSVAPMEPKPALSTLSQEVSLIVNESGYYPSRIFATVHVPLRIFLTTPSKSTQCFMLDSWGVRKGVVPGKVEEVEFTPDRPGTYRFYCPVKATEGTLVVREAPEESWIGRGVPTNNSLSQNTVKNQNTTAQNKRGDPRFTDEEFQQAFRSPAEAKEVERSRDEIAPNYNEPKNAAALRRDMIED